MKSKEMRELEVCGNVTVSENQREDFLNECAIAGLEVEITDECEDENGATYTRYDLVLSLSLAAIAAVNPDGYTVNAETLEPLTSGYSVAVAGTQDSFGPEGLARVIAYQAAHKECTAFGGWLDSETGRYYYDACIIVGTKAEAMALAKENKQIAFFCLHELKEYNQDGTERNENK